MRRQEIIDRLCRDEPDSPYPLEALYELEGLTYPELMELLRTSQATPAGQSMPPLRGRGERRRRIVESLGVSEATSSEVATAAASAVDSIAVALRRAGVEIPEGHQPRVLDIAAQLLTASGVAFVSATETEQDRAARTKAAVERSVEVALLLVDEVERRFAAARPAFAKAPGVPWRAS